MRNAYILQVMVVLLVACFPYQSWATDLPEHYYLQPGDSVAVISPSTLPTPAQLKATVNGLRQWGYVPVVGPFALCDVRTLEDCEAELMWALRDPTLRAIYCVRGGYSSSEVMDRLPLDTLRRYPKLIIGYSDVTIYHAAWTTIGLPSIHASMSATFMNLPDTCAKLQRRMMAGEMPKYSFPSGKYHHNGSAEGILIGGNMSTFVAALQTAYDCTRTEGPFILLLEDVNTRYQWTHRMFTIMQHLGVLDRMAGIILGEWADFSEGTSYLGHSRGGKWNDVYEMLFRQIFPTSTVPVATKVPVGHGKYNYPMRMGGPVRLIVDDQKTEIQFL